jgi:hypothetical protein
MWLACVWMLKKNQATLEKRGLYYISTTALKLRLFPTHAQFVRIYNYRRTNNALLMSV